MKNTKHNRCIEREDGEDYHCCDAVEIQAPAKETLASFLSLRFVKRNMPKHHLYLQNFICMMHDVEPSLRTIAVFAQHLTHRRPYQLKRKPPYFAEDDIDVAINHTQCLPERAQGDNVSKLGLLSFFRRGTNKNIKRSDLTLFTSSLHNVHLETKARFQVAAQLLGLPSNLKSTPTAALQRLNGNSRMEAVPFSTPKHDQALKVLFSRANCPGA